MVNESIVDKYLLKQTGVNHTVAIFEEEYVRHHCSGDFLGVYLEFGKYVLLVLMFVGHVVVTRKALLYFKPEWGGKRKRVVEF